MPAKACCPAAEKMQAGKRARQPPPQTSGENTHGTKVQRYHLVVDTSSRHVQYSKSQLLLVY